MSRALAALLVGALTLPVAQAPAHAAAPAESVQLSALPYQFTVRAAAAENFVHYFRELVQGAGFTRVQLAHRRNAKQGAARAVAAAYWLISDDEPCLLGCEPPCPPAFPPNPTVSRTSSPLECDELVPGVGAVGLPPESGEPVPDAASFRSVSAAPSDTTASALSRVLDPPISDQITLGAGGSTVDAMVNRSTAEFTGTARSFISDLALPGGTLASVASLLQVTARPEQEPVVSYRLSVLDGSGGGTTSGVTERGFTIAGYEIPASELVANVNDQVEDLDGTLGSPLELGVRVLAPQVGFDPDARYRIAAPVLAIGAGPTTRGPLATGDTGIRLAPAVFEGAHRAPDPPLRSVAR